MNHGSLFSGIGGFDYAAQLMGWNNIFHCEKNTFGQRILKYYWPKSISYEDITKTNFSIHRGKIDILTGGFPCQPFSVAGKQEGTEDERHLWPEMLRAIGEIQPRWVVGENVRGIISWNGGLVFEQVQVDLENKGYKVFPFLLPAAGVNAPHKRDRVWFVAYNQSSSSTWEYFEGSSKGGFRGLYSETFPTNANSLGGLQDYWTRKSGQFNQEVQRGNWQDFPTQTSICNGDDGIPSRLDAITFPKWRSESIMGGGNAIVPQVAIQIFKAIEQYETIHQH